MPTKPGVYSATASGINQYVYVDSSCNTKQSFITDGTITLTKVDAGVYAGSGDVTIDPNQHVKFTFETVYCEACAVQVPPIAPVCK